MFTEGRTSPILFTERTFSAIQRTGEAAGSLTAVVASS